MGGGWRIAVRNVIDIHRSQLGTRRSVAASSMTTGVGSSEQCKRCFCGIDMKVVGEFASWFIGVGEILPQ